MSLVLDVTAVVARISAGRLTALQSGHCDVTATLAMQGIDVATQRARLDLPGMIGFGSGIPLLRHDPATSDMAGEPGGGEAAAGTAAAV